MILTAFRGRPARFFLLISLGLVFQACTGTQEDIPVANEERTPASGFFGLWSPKRVLMIGDSLTVGGFGDSMQDYLLKRFGHDDVAIYASCGSSPEQWLRSQPEYITKCGYREQTPQSTVLYDSVDGKRPPPAVTPKLEDLVALMHPTTVIIQLGTNWMDDLSLHSVEDEVKHSQILDRFIAAIHSEPPGSVRQIIWITPPDSSHYSSQVQQAVQDLIKTAAERDSFDIIDSSRLTHYVPGKSGGDGIHYNREEAQQWASLVTQQLDRLIR